jgi:hypothetical protein
MPIDTSGNYTFMAPANDNIKKDTTLTLVSVKELIDTTVIKKGINN